MKASAFTRPMLGTGREACDPVSKERTRGNWTLVQFREAAGQGETPGHYDILVFVLAVANRARNGLDQHAFVQGLAQNRPPPRPRGIGCAVSGSS